MLVAMPAIVAPVVHGAPSPFNGRWTIDLSSSRAAPEPVEITLRGGRFTRREGQTSVTVPADGRVHPIRSDTYLDAIAVILRGRGQIDELDLFHGKPAYRVTYTASPTRMRSTATDLSKPDGKPVLTTLRYRRLGAPGRNVSLVAGRWRQEAVETSRALLTETFRLAGGRFSDARVGGAGFDAMVGGPAVPIRGDAGQVAITMPDARTIVERMSIGGKPSFTLTLRLLPGDRAIAAVGQRPGERVGPRYLLRRQAAQ
jgi:hypothetical protein